MIPPLACLMACQLRYIHPHVSRNAQVDVPCRQTKIRRNRVEFFLTVTHRSASCGSNYKKSNFLNCFVETGYEEDRGFPFVDQNMAKKVLSINN
jgi:hypothetical protein